MRDFGRYRAVLALAIGLAGPVGGAQAQSASPANLPAQINAEFQAVKLRAAQVQLELPRLDQALNALAAHLKDRADLSPAEKAASIARVGEARAVLRSHGEALRRAASYFGRPGNGSDAGPAIDGLANLLNVESDKIANLVADETARRSGDAERLATAHAAYRKAVTALVDAAKKAREDARAAGEQGQLVGGSGGRKKTQQ